jgi:hypothetical protein
MQVRGGRAGRRCGPCKANSRFSVDTKCLVEAGIDAALNCSDCVPTHYQSATAARRRWILRCSCQPAACLIGGACKAGVRPFDPGMIFKILAFDATLWQCGYIAMSGQIVDARGETKDEGGLAA